VELTEGPPHRELTAGEDLDADGRAGVARFGVAGQGVVIGQGEQGEPDVSRAADDLVGPERPVGCGRVEVEVGRRIAQDR